jgi:hypothetical protein
LETIIIKVGGSLALHPEKLRILCRKLTELSSKHKLVVVPGGGEFADTVRNLDLRFHLSPQVSHRMAILGMDQYGLLLADLLPSSSLIDKLECVKEILDSGKLPIFFPFASLFRDETLENSWDVTSDAITAFVAGQLHNSKAILLTDVDGIYNCDPKKFPEAKLIRELSARDLSEMNVRTSVDKFLPKLLLQFQIECFVVNGLYPQRVEAILNGKKTTYTRIIARP